MDQSDNLGNLAKDMVESSEAFHDQFNPNSVNFHGGIPVPVPLGGQRVPDSMPTIYPENCENLNEYVNSQEPDYGPEYAQCLKFKEFFNSNLKKNLNRLTQQQEALLRHKETFKKLGNPQNSQHQQTYEANMQKDTQLLKDEIKELYRNIEFVQQQPQQEEYKEKYLFLTQIVELAQKEYNTKEELFDFGALVKQATSLAFKENQKLTEQIKGIKKQKQN